MSKVIPFPKTMEEAPRPRRKRSMTSIALSWLSERMSKADEIKQRIDSGTYRIPKDKVAQVLAHPGVGEEETNAATMASTDRA